MPSGWTLQSILVPSRAADADALDVETLRMAARGVGLPNEVTVADIEDLAAEYDRIHRETHR
jgi:hypothetical protein